MYLTGQADRRHTRDPGNTFRLSAVALLHLFMKRHLQHRKLHPCRFRMPQHCTQNKRRIDESLTKHDVNSQTISGKCLKCLRLVESTYVLDKKNPLQYFA